VQTALAKYEKHPYIFTQGTSVQVCKFQPNPTIFEGSSCPKVLAKFWRLKQRQMCRHTKAFLSIVNSIPSR